MYYALAYWVLGLVSTGVFWRNFIMAELIEQNVATRSDAAAWAVLVIGSSFVWPLLFGLVVFKKLWVAYSFNVFDKLAKILW